MSLAAETRDAVRREPFLYDALRAGVLNYTAAARHLDLGDEEAVAAALRRYREDLPPPGAADRDARVTMRSGLGPAEAPADALLVVGGAALAPDGGDRTGIQATGDLDPLVLGRVLRRLGIEDVEVSAAGAVAGTILVVVDRRAGANALRVVEDALSSSD